MFGTSSLHAVLMNLLTRRKENTSRFVVIQIYDLHFEICIFFRINISLFLEIWNDLCQIFKREFRNLHELLNFNDIFSYNLIFLFNTSSLQHTHTKITINSLAKRWKSPHCYRVYNLWDHCKRFVEESKHKYQCLRF